MDRKRVMIVVAVDLDPIEGAFHTPEDARNAIENILNDRICHYNPKVIVLNFEPII